MPSQSFRLQVPEQAIARIHDTERRTLVLRKVSPTTTPTSILKDLQAQCKQPLGNVVESVVRESLDRRRFYLRFHSVELKRKCAMQGFTIGDVKIPPQLADVQGSIPDVPHYLDREDVIKILSRFGDVVNGDFVRFEETNIRCGKFTFELNLHENKKLPSTIYIMNDSFTINCKDDLQQCAYCDKYGHIARFCLKKREDTTKRAKEKLDQQALQELDNEEEDTHMDDFNNEDDPLAPQHDGVTVATGGEETPKGTPENSTMLQVPRNVLPALTDDPQLQQQQPVVTVVQETPPPAMQPIDTVPPTQTAPNSTERKTSILDGFTHGGHLTMSPQHTSVPQTLADFRATKQPQDINLTYKSTVEGVPDMDYESFEQVRHEEYRKHKDRIWEEMYPELDELPPEDFKKLEKRAIEDTQASMSTRYGTMWTDYVKEYYRRRAASKEHKQ